MGLLIFCGTLIALWIQKYVACFSPGEFMPDLDLLVLGTGPAATQVVLTCAEAGWRVGIVDPRPYGGTCALRGCNPKKVLVRAAELYDWIGRAQGSGIRVVGATIDWSELIAFKRTFTDPVTENKERKFEEAGIEQFHGVPRFTGPQSVTVGGREVASRRIVVATGAVPRKLNVPGEELLTDSDAFLDLPHLPRRVLFVGGGYVTFEFAHVAARAGAEVTIIETGDRPLAKFDHELVDCLVDRTRELGVDLRTSASVEAIERLRDGTLAVAVNSGETSASIVSDLVVHGAGRVANTEGLDLEAGQIRFGPDGIAVDEYLQSMSNPAVWAAGDVAATAAPPLSPVAGEEGKTLAHNFLHSEQRRPAYGPVATVVFSVPALAAVGLGEDEARERGLRFTVRAGDRSGDNSMKKVGAKHSRYKVLVEEPSGRILGAHLLGPDAAETINLFALAIKHGITAEDLRSTLFAFPTFAHDIRGMV